MPSSYTTNYQLNQWARSDRVLMEDFNADNAKIDAAVKAEADARAAEDASLHTALGQKADTSALNSLQAVVNGKADQSALAGKADASALTALTKQVTSLERNALQAKTGSYTGTGTYGEKNPQTLTFPKLPVLLIVRNLSGYEALVLVQGMTSTSSSMGSSGTGSRVTAAWDSSKKQVSWYGDAPKSHMNESGTKYYYIGIF